jgi:hypothetical protein
MPSTSPVPKLLAISDLHVVVPENRKVIADLRPGIGRRLADCGRRCR